MVLLGGCFRTVGTCRWAANEKPQYLLGPGDVLQSRLRRHGPDRVVPISDSGGDLESADRPRRPGLAARTATKASSPTQARALKAPERAGRD